MVVFFFLLLCPNAKIQSKSGKDGLNSVFVCSNVGLANLFTA